MVLMLGLLAGFIYQFCVLNITPQFMRYPPEVDFSETEAWLHTKFGTTLAVGIEHATTAEARVRFLARDSSRIDAVYCTDLYREEIEMERNSTSGDDYFTQMFSDWNGFKWICPNITILHTDFRLGIDALVVPCKQEPNAVYAAGDTNCSTLPPGTF